MISHKLKDHTMTAGSEKSWAYYTKPAKTWGEKRGEKRGNMCDKANAQANAREGEHAPASPRERGRVCVSVYEYEYDRHATKNT